MTNQIGTKIMLQLCAIRFPMICANQNIKCFNFRILLSNLMCQLLITATIKKVVHGQKSATLSPQFGTEVKRKHTPQVA